ncbi:uncharacterized protein LOC109948014 [Prunus persica]|uniref:uncharacterized protein LOC109948014 n=1 Tax=Prunus persica TaxID=3760 RepID=UPI0009AB265A|nr:uncharacterized protein LOC109948014 [Prunus persica]
MASESALRFQLMDLQKGSQPIDTYLRHAKSLADSLAAINEPVSPKELVTAVLQGLGSDYKMLVKAILNFPPLPDFANLRARLLAFDAQAPRISHDQNTVLMATQSSPHTTGHTSFPSHRGGGSSSNMCGGWHGRGRCGWSNFSSSWSNPWNGFQQPKWPNQPWPSFAPSSGSQSSWPSIQPPWAQSAASSKHSARPNSAPGVLGTA